MPAVVIVGAQWGDEGKGKVTDYLARGADTVVRYQGGNNAGHTIVANGTTYKFHLIPSGMLYADKLCVLGNGMVVDPQKLIEELDALQAEGRDTSLLKVSAKAHYILPSHKALDKQTEERKGAHKIGTTGRGIGPAYRDKVHRCGVRVGDPGHPKTLRNKVALHFAEHGAFIDSNEWTVNSMTEYLLECYERLKGHVCDAAKLINDRLDRGSRLLLEGAQGTLLDIDHGTYPYVTSSNPTAGGACIGSGVGPTRISRVLGVSKAYATRVGSGSFPSELKDEVGQMLLTRGQEYGTTTGRPRRCGWLDLVALKYAVRINAMTRLAITKLDVLDACDEVKLCTAYRVGGEVTDEFPIDSDVLATVEPIYDTVPGWKRPTTEARRWSELPDAAVAYLNRIEEYTRVPIGLLSVGADREATFSKIAIWEGI
jgi:adenylosuccinate synthase